MIEEAYFCLLTLVVSIAALHSNLKAALLFLWVAQMLVGFWYFSLGIPLLSILQCLLGAVTALCLLFFYILMHQPSALSSVFRLKSFFLFLGILFIGLALYFLLHQVFYGKVLFAVENRKEIDFSAVLLKQHFAPLLIVPFIAFVVMIGGAAVCRHDTDGI
jgi:hypothetical protein